MGEPLALLAWAQLGLDLAAVDRGPRARRVARVHRVERALRRGHVLGRLEQAKIHDYIDAYLNGLLGSAPPPEFRITSQVDGELRELRVRFANTRYRVLYQRSGLLITLLHIFEKNSAGTPPREIALANERFADFKARMDARPRRRPRAAGHDAP